MLQEISINEHQVMIDTSSHTKHKVSLVQTPEEINVVDLGEI